MFQKTLQFQYAIVLYYNKQTVVRIIDLVPPPLTWQIFQIIVDYLSPVVFTRVMNQSCGHWLLNDDLHSTISMNLKCRGKNQVLPSFENLMDDDSIVNDELSLLVFNIRREVINVLDYFLSFLKVSNKRKTHNMIFLMLDPKYKILHKVPSFVGSEQGVALLEEYDNKSLYLMLAICHKHLHPLVKLKTNYTNQFFFIINIAIWIYLNKLQAQMN